MNNLLYVIAVILVVFWALGLVFSIAGNLIHLLLLIAVIMVLLKVIRRPTAV
ncbi:lmo0937 family membrane protein [Mucilaginibacter pallidiroseus]|uniref:Lmo0937 family membrane protein n=1 Tax=Mucilaginibacter pallidiroseus TaxID=2599295 RepID=A0A563UGL4_9SPHI|nr:lmo0937 family membrane protein [Mucilaginibacter pallidiroseus]TWR30446.1 lmo0937 family membrane protein [Mucilaginibacter pallidiroseus]